MNRLRTILAILLLAGSGLGAGLLASKPLLARSADPAWREAALDHGRLALRDGLAVAELSGSPAERGTAHGRLVGSQVGDLLAIMGLNPLPTVAGERLKACIAAIEPDDRAEIEALAAAAGEPAERILVANATIETMCSAAVRAGDGAAPVVARNMDFFPPAALGPSTMIQVVRAPGRHAYAAVGWPGMVGVISGMNDAGLTACILLNWHGDHMPPGEPLPLRVRRMLQAADSVDAAIAVLRSAPTGSPHYVLLADRHDVALAWWTASAGVHVDRPTAGWLVVTNLARTAAGIPVEHDLRGYCLSRAIGHLDGREPDDAWFRRVVGASYMPIDNAQAMVFRPAERRLELALAAGKIAAARGPWRILDLGPVLDGAPVGGLAVGHAPPAPPLHHYLLGGPD